MITETPKPITVTVSGWDRLWVADALRTEARTIRAEYQGRVGKRRAKTQYGKMALERADRLWMLALDIQP